MTPYVPDASVAAKWFLPAADEPNREQALELARRYAAGEIQFFVPDLFFAEFANVMWKAERLGRCSTKASDEAVAEILGLGLPVLPTAELLHGARAIARTHRRTIYDSLYIAAALATGAMFVTADKKLANAIRGGLPVEWLGALRML
jgi:predicted nucleic acid-binding protein